MKILILGGINEAVGLAKELHQRDLKVIYSIAGLVRQPDLHCKVVTGGFSADRRARSLPRIPRTISLLLDATHPYASQMSAAGGGRGRGGRNSVLAVSARSLGKAGRRQLASVRQMGAAQRTLLVDHEAVLFTAGRLDAVLCRCAVRVDPR